MPANLTPVYRKAEEAYRNAREPAEKLEHLKEMLRTIPKHKGTDHLQGDIKRWIKEITEEIGAASRAARRRVRSTRSGARARRRSPSSAHPTPASPSCTPS